MDRERGTEMITEVYVSRRVPPSWPRSGKDFLAQGRYDLRTIRFIEKDRELIRLGEGALSVHRLQPARAPHERGEMFQKAADDFRRIIDRAIQHGGAIT